MIEIIDMVKDIQSQVKTKYVLAIMFVAALLVSLLSFTIYIFTRTSASILEDKNNEVEYNNVDNSTSESAQINADSSLVTNQPSNVINAQVYSGNGLYSDIDTNRESEIIREQKLQMDLMQIEINQAKYDAALARIDAEEARIKSSYPDSSISMYSKEK